jgi:hypothetical protein
MKLLLLITTFLFSVQNIFANGIDSLKTDDDVLTFLKSINEDFRSAKYKPIELRSTETLRQELDCDGMAEKWQVNNWEKVDFNNDGKMDLLVMLYWYDYGVYVVMDNGDGTYKLLTLSYNIHEKCELAKPMEKDGQQLLLYYQKKHIVSKNSKTARIEDAVDTLMYKYGGFIELNRKPANYQIDSVSFKTGYCFGSCPVFTIAFDKDGNAVYDASTYNPKQGFFTGTIKKEDLENIIGLINYLNIKKLDNDYKVSWTDDQTCWLTIKFSDGKVKTIQDYGMKGTAGLRLLYNMFFDLRASQEWK